MNEMLPEGWSFTPVEKLKSSEPRALAAGPFGSSISSKFFVDEGVPVIRGGNLSEGKERFIPTGFVFITPSKAEEFKGAQVQAGDLVFTCWGTLGQVGLIPKSGPYEKYVISNKQLKLRPDAKIASSEFLYYYFSSPSLRKRFSDVAIGSAVPGINLGILRRELVPLPPLRVQEKIAAILTAYDDLIETNKRRIALLEKMAEELYREWFVRMRFPGHRNTKFIKGVPEGWSFDLGSTFFDHVKGKSYSSPEISDEEGLCFFITLKSFHRRGGYRKEGLKYYSGSYKYDQCVRAGDVVMAVTDMTQDRAVVGEVARIPSLPGKQAVISLDVIRLLPKKMSTTFLYAYMRHSGFANYIKEFANGANVLHLKPDLVGKQRILFPPNILREQFADLADPIYKEAGALEDANDLLAKTRDLLLPRLISGKLSVEDLDIQFPPSMREDASTPIQDLER